MVKPGYKSVSAQALIGYEALAESGICFLGGEKYSISLRLSDVNYSLATPSVQENLIEKYAQFINSHLADTHVQISVINQVADKIEIGRKACLPLRGDGFDKYRHDYNSLIDYRLISGRNNTITDKVLTLSVSAPSFEEAKVMLTSRAAEAVALLREVGGCRAQVMDGVGRFNVLANFLLPGVKSDFKYEDLLGCRCSTKDFLSPVAFDFTDPKSFTISAGVDKSWRIFILRKLPAWLSDRLLKDLSEIPFDMCVSIHFDPVEQSQGLALVKHQIASLDIQRSNEQRKLAKQGLNTDHGSHELQASYREAVELRDQLEQSNEKLFETTILIGVAGDDSAQLAENVARVSRVCGKHSCDLEVLKFMQKDALNALLPLGRCDLPIKRTLTTAALAVLEPFTTQELFDDEGIFYGVNGLSKNLIMLARQDGMNANGFILGTSGSGKSQFAKFEMMQIFLRRPTDEVLIIDPEREYVALADALEASRVVISPGSKHALNALEIDRDFKDLDEDPIRAKCGFVLSLCEVLLGGVDGLSNVERSVLDRCSQNIYRQYFNNSDVPMPTLMSLYQELQLQPETEAAKLAGGLEIYAKGSAAGFAAATNVDLSSRMVVYDLADLGRDLQTFGMMVVLENIWARIRANKERGVRTWLYIDEFHLLFDNEYAATYCQSIYKRVRKYGAGATGITQNIEELLLNDRARLMLSNSDCVFLLNQQATDGAALADLLHLSAQQRSFFTNAAPGCGLLKAGASVIPFDNKMDVKSSIFQIFQTTFKQTPTAGAVSEEEGVRDA